MIYETILDTVGKTPLVRLEQNVFAKIEFFNPSGSVKDRAAIAMLDDAEKRGLVEKDTVIIEPTSGNTGIGLAMAAAVKGYRLILTMPSSMSEERKNILKAYGAELRLSDSAKGMQGAIELAHECAKESPKSFIPSQFDNLANARAHELTTAPELFSELSNIEWIVSAVGSGGTAMGMKDYILKNKLDTKVCAVEPEESPLLSKGRAGKHIIQGIGANFLPSIVDKNKLDRIECVSGEQAKEAMRFLARTKGMLVGISSGAAYVAAMRLKESCSKNIAVIFPDTGMRYLSGGFFS